MLRYAICQYMKSLPGKSRRKGKGAYNLSWPEASDSLRSMSIVLGETARSGRFWKSSGIAIVRSSFWVFWAEQALAGCLRSWRLFLKAHALQVRSVFASPCHRHTGVCVVPHHEHLCTKLPVSRPYTERANNNSKFSGFVVIINASQPIRRPKMSHQK